MPGHGEYEARKRELLAGLAGTVLEIGAGTGANFGSFGAGIRWIGLEPRSANRQALPRHARTAVLGGVAEHIPLRDHSVDGVIATVVLCAVRDQDRVLTQIVRVLRPGGVFVFAEHVAAPSSPFTRAAQQVWGRTTKRWFEGCRTGRRTWQAIERAGFATVRLDWYALPGRGLYNPYIAGRAVTGDG